MKLLIASDIHGSARWCEALMNAIDTEKPDRLILLGDLLYHGPRNDLPDDYAPKKVIEMLEERGVRDKVKVMIGGSPVSPRFAKEIGADGYSTNAVEAVKLARKLTKTD